jgi:hypothetical protein
MNLRDQGKISDNETGNSTKILLASGEVFTGVWESPLQWNSSIISISGTLSTAEGTLYIEESDDASTIRTSVPYNISNPIIDVPKSWKNVERYFRIRYVNGAVTQTGAFSISTRYVNDASSILATMGESINNNSTGAVVKSVIAGEKLDGNLDATNQYDNVKLLENGALKTGIPGTVLFEAKRPTDPTIPSGATITIDPVLNVEANVVDSGWIPITGFMCVFTVITGDTPLQVYVLNSSDTLGSNLQGNAFPIMENVAGSNTSVSGPSFSGYVRVVVVNTSGVTANEYSLLSKGNQTATAGILLSIDTPVFGSLPATVNRSVAVGKDPNDIYKNVRSDGYVDAATTEANLGVGGIFDSGCIFVNGYSQLSLELLSDQVGVLTGTWYTDAACANAVRTLTIPYGSVNEFVPISSPTFGKYLQIIYTNGGVAQTNFHMAIKFHSTSISGFVLGLDTPIAPNAVANLQRVVNSADLDRNRNKIIGEGAHRKFGYNETVANNNFEVIWAGAHIDGTLNYPFPQTAETLRVKAGGNVNDTSAGIGARTILISGLDENWDEVIEVVTLNGASASAATTATFFRVNHVEIVTVGTYGGGNTGNIVIENTASVQALAYIPTGLGNTQQAVYTVPADKTAYITKIKVSVGQGNSADIRLFHIDTADVLAAPFGPKHFEWGVEDYSGADIFTLATYLKVEEKNDIFADSQRITGSGQARVSFDFEYILVSNV